MKPQWHVNRHGIAEQYGATINPCPLNSRHYDSAAEANAAAQTDMKEEHDIITTLTKGDDMHTTSPEHTDPAEHSAQDTTENNTVQHTMPASLTSEEFKQLHTANVHNAENFLQATAAFEAAHDEHAAHNRGRRAFRNFPVTDAMFDAHMQQKAAMYAFAVTDTIHKQHAAEHGVSRDDLPITSYAHYEQEIANFEAWKTKQQEIAGTTEYVPDHNPSLNGKAGDRHYNKAVNMLGALTGRKPWDVKKRVDMLQQQRGISRHEAVDLLYQSATPRTDKPFVFLDLETAARQPDDIGTVDTGKYSDIIEVGYIKVYPDGRTAEESFLLDADDNLKKTAGTGAESIHNISPGMIEGKPQFSDPAVQQNMTQALNNSVLVAHGANFENTQLSYSLRGFAAERSKFNIEILDTKDVSTYFMKTENGNKNEDFVETAGFQYSDDAHRAFTDANMTRKAFYEVLNNREKYLDTNREKYTSPRSSQDGDNNEELSLF